MGKKALFLGLTGVATAIAVFLIFGADLTNSVIETGSFLGNTEEINIPENIVVNDTQPEQKEVIKRDAKLANPPEKINALYATFWSASSSSKINYLISLIKSSEANALVIDIKDFSGRIAYASGNPEISKYGTENPVIGNVNALLDKLHAENIYVIARVTVFQDPALVASRPDLAIKNVKTNKPWVDGKNLSWVDPSSEEVWHYNMTIAKNALDRGFDEVNFDYIRFPTDGALTDMSFPFYTEDKTKREVIKSFFVFLRESLEDEIISGDLFGLTTSAQDDMGIGQYLEDAYGNFDFICPMVYPSHFGTGFIGYKNPALYPYEVVKYSGAQAEKRLSALVPEGEEPLSKLRPWLQDFDLGAEYGADKIKLQIQAVAETSDAGWMLWDPTNNYTKEGFSE
jgi:hypothetical protein